MTRAWTSRTRVPPTGGCRVGHEGKRQPSKSAPQELHFGANHDPGYRVPHIVADLVAARPIDLAIIDGVESVAGGEGPWIRGLRIVKPGVLIAGLNPVCTDAVATAVMGYNPRAARGTAPFQHLRQHARAGRRSRRRDHGSEAHRRPRGGSRGCRVPVRSVG